MKKLFLIITLAAFAAFGSSEAKAQEKEVTLYFFWTRGCSHCAQAKEFLGTLTTYYPQLEIKQMEITENPQYAKVLNEAVKKLGVEAPYVPITIVGENLISGFFSEESTGQQIEQAIQCAIQNHCQDIVGPLTNEGSQAPPPRSKTSLPKSIKLPLWGELDLSNLSLPLITVVIAALDGFNPCAMWTLVFLISLLLGMKDRRRMWILGTAFVVSSGLVYFLFLAAWLNVFLFLGFVLWIRVLISLAALATGSYNLRDFWINRNGACQVTNSERRRAFMERLKLVTQRSNFLLALVGIVVLAIAVNLIELVCSAGLPAIYTQILSLTPLPAWRYYLYLALYIVVFMLDDLVVFVVAMTTLHAMGVDGRYSRFSRLIGGLLMLLIGALLLFKPEWLMFG